MCSRAAASTSRAHYQIVVAHDGIDARQVALDLLRHRAEDILLIPGASLVPHVEENLVRADRAIR